MKKYLALVALMFGLAGAAMAGTPQETFYQGQAPLSGTTINRSSTSALGTATVTLTVAAPTAINSGGGTYNGRNCFTNWDVQMGSYTILTIQDGSTEVKRTYGLQISSTGGTQQYNRDHLGPFCTSANAATVFTLTPTSGNPAIPHGINVEGYTTYGGTNNAGPML